MLQTLISLEDRDINTVLDAVTEWCKANHAVIDSAEGRRAITAAVDLVCNHGSANLLQEVSARLHRPNQNAA